ncbi:MAG: Dihydrolipoyl dehydrogenase [Pelotomaculum sp. PtaB.Bin104]|nr:MAG: Dihydrolipoyl dehydrogenase [Pelotomaculum sp. PtaB.Bin104]
MANETFDIIFLGGGPAGYQGAIRAAQLGLRAAVVESAHLGGTCLNWGCIPTKTIKASADLLHQARRAKEYGLEIGSVRPDLGAIISRKNKVVGLLRSGVQQLLRGNGVILYQGHGRVISPAKLAVKNERGTALLKTKKVVIATGSRQLLPGPFAGGKQGVLTTNDILNISSIPKSLMIVGAGAVGVEMASIMAELGSSVTLLEMADHILPGEDREMSDLLTRMLKRQKVNIITGVTVTEVEPGPEVRLTLSDNRVIAGEAVLVAAGRAPNLESTGLAELGLDSDKGPLAVNERMETAVPGIYAAGDVTGGWLLAHVAFAEGIVAAENAAGLESQMNYRVIPRCVFSIPEYGAVGLSEEKAKELFPAASYTFPLRALGMAQAMGERDGLVKLVVHQKTGKILGGHIVGPHAGDLVAEIALAMRHGLTAKKMVKTMHIHPTLSEAVLETAQAASGQAIHIMPVK